jgi:hypothetical protein
MNEVVVINYSTKLPSMHGFLRPTNAVFVPRRWWLSNSKRQEKRP